MECESFDPYHVWLGISPGEQPPHHYRLLGIPLFESEPEVIEAAADRQMTYLRQVSHGKRAELSQKLLNEVSAAKLCLLHPGNKAEYDRVLKEKLAPRQPGADSGTAPQKVPSKTAASTAGPLRVAQPLQPAKSAAVAVAPQPVIRTGKTLAKAHRRRRRNAAPLLLLTGVGMAAIGLVAALGWMLVNMLPVRDGSHVSASEQRAAARSPWSAPTGSTARRGDQPESLPAPTQTETSAKPDLPPPPQPQPALAKLELPDGKIIDDVDEGHHRIGEWTPLKNSSVLGGQLVYHPPGAGEAKATWTFDVMPGGRYYVLASWPHGSNRAQHAPYIIRSGDEVIARFERNQKVPADDVQAHGIAWESLGVFDLDASPLIVELTNESDALVMADAVLIVEVKPLTAPLEIIDDGDFAYRETGTGWESASTGNGYQGDVRFHAPGDGSTKARWVFECLTAGARYHVYTTWAPGSNRGKDVPYTIIDGTSTLATVRVMQTGIPAGITAAGRPWRSLGSYTTNSGTVVVEMSNDTDGVIIADAVRVVPAN